MIPFGVAGIRQVISTINGVTIRTTTSRGGEGAVETEQ